MSRSYRQRAGDVGQVQMYLRIPKALRQRFQAEAKRRAVSMNLLGERAIEEALTRWEKEDMPS
jgi:predicted HicB family RNase H-like nuclease